MLAGSSPWTLKSFQISAAFLQVAVAKGPLPGRDIGAESREGRLLLFPVLLLLLRLRMLPRSNMPILVVATRRKSRLMRRTH